MAWTPPHWHEWELPPPQSWILSTSFTRIYGISSLWKTTGNFCHISFHFQGINSDLSYSPAVILVFAVTNKIKLSKQGKLRDKECMWEQDTELFGKGTCYLQDFIIIPEYRLKIIPWLPSKQLLSWYS